MTQKNKKSLFYRLTEWMVEKTGMREEIKEIIRNAYKSCDNQIRDLKHEYQNSIRDISARAKQENLDLANQVDALTNRNMSLSTQLGKFEDVTHKNMSHNMDLQFLEANCDKPLLWVCCDPAMHNAGAFGRIRDKLQKICPKVDMMVFTPHGTKLQELDDEDLFRIGLVRIRMDRLTPENMKKLKEMVYGLPESKLQIKGA